MIAKQASLALASHSPAAELCSTTAEGQCAGSLVRCQDGGRTVWVCKMMQERPEPGTECPEKALLR